MFMHASFAAFKLTVGALGRGEVGCFLGARVLCEHDLSGPIASREELKEKCVL